MMAKTGKGHEPSLYRELLFKASVTTLSFHATNAYNYNEHNTNGIKSSNK
jgi:hypothetical protein